jgi:redox-regulated HSP33 family molecular chaperone
VVSALKVALAKATAKRMAKGKTLTLRLRSTGALSAVTVQVRKGSKVVGKGTAKQLAGTGAVKVRLSKALGKGRYTVAVTGTDASGAKQTATAALKVR